MTEKASQVGDNEVVHHLAKMLSSHGHGFHYAVLRRAGELCDVGKSDWILEAAEFPVQVGDHVTHIDFVCRARKGCTYLVAECKRADPGRARWCFVKAPYTWRDGGTADLVFEQVGPAAPGGRAETQVVESREGVCHLGVELKANSRGDGTRNSKAIDEAVAQVLRATNGLIDYLYRPTHARSDQPAPAWFLPVVFTTAQLWVSTADLSAACLLTGKVDAGEVRRVEWLWFNHNQSPALQHSLERTEDPEDLSAALGQEFTRTVAIVAAEGIDGFLRAGLRGRGLSNIRWKGRADRGG